VDDDAELELPAEVAAGVYADRLFAWFARHHLTLDFVAPASDDSYVVNARVHVPATVALDVLESLEQVVRGYKLEVVEIRRPRRRGEE